jgi:hypothetical protein
MPAPKPTRLVGPFGATTSPMGMATSNIGVRSRFTSGPRRVSRKAQPRTPWNAWTRNFKRVLVDDAAPAADSTMAARARELLARGCGRRAARACMGLGQAILRPSAASGGAAAVLAAGCAGGDAASCAGSAVLSAPLVSPHPDCGRAMPPATRACAGGNGDGCTLADACRLTGGEERAPALARLSGGCQAKAGLACLYWADGQGTAAAAALIGPAQDRGAGGQGDGGRTDPVAAVYRLACDEGAIAAPLACPRALAAELARAVTAHEAVRLLEQLDHGCDQSSGEACCLLGEAFLGSGGAWTRFDADRAALLRARLPAREPALLSARFGARPARLVREMNADGDSRCGPIRACPIQRLDPGRPRELSPASWRPSGLPRL